MNFFDHLTENEQRGIFTESQARFLAARDESGAYRARKLRGQWIVWCDASDHVVEFDASTIIVAR